MVGFNGSGWVEDQKMIKDKLIDGKRIVSRFRGKLVKRIKHAGSIFDDYYFCLKLDKFGCIGCYELTEKRFFINQKI